MTEPAFWPSCAAWLQAVDFSWWGSPVTRAEWLGALLALGMVVCNARVSAWGWPLAMSSSLLYAVVFLDNRLYGQALLQGVFVLMAGWGLWQWIAPHRAQANGLGSSLSRHPRAAPAAVRQCCGWATLLLWGLIGTGLSLGSDSPAPYADALPTAGSLVATWLLGRKYSDNWPAWLAVNLCAMGLFAHQRLWPTVALYGVFALTSAWGWWVWTRRPKGGGA